MANSRIVKETPITWTTVGGTDYSQPIAVADYRDVGITLVGTGTITVLGTKQWNTSGSAPDFTSPSTITNSYAAIVIADETTPNTYATTIAVAGATKLAEVNSNLVTWICLTRSINTVDAFVTYCTNL